MKISTLSEGTRIAKLSHRRSPKVFGTVLMVLALLVSGGFFDYVIFNHSRFALATPQSVTDSSDNQLSSNNFVSPYSTVIGYIGDSITSASYPVATATAKLGSDFSFVNKGLGYTTSTDWANNDFLGAPILTDAINAFSEANVDIVSIMLGTNDAKAYINTSPPTYKSNLQTIIDALKAAGIRQVILQRPPYINYVVAPASDEWSATSITSLTNYYAALQDLADDNYGYVVLGDTNAYDWFYSNQTELNDGIHPTSTGYTKLGEFWADAIKADLEHQINPSKTWLGSDNSFTLGETGTLTLSIDKYFGEFSGVIAVDGNVLSAGDYTATAGSTVVELANVCLNGFAVGSHTLSAQFNGGVSVNSQFTIVAKGPNGNNSDSTVPGALILVRDLAVVAIALVGIALIGRKLVKR